MLHWTSHLLHTLVSSWRPLCKMLLAY